MNDFIPVVSSAKIPLVFAIEQNTLQRALGTGFFAAQFLVDFGDFCGTALDDLSDFGDAKVGFGALALHVLI